MTGFDRSLSLAIDRATILAESDNPLEREFGLPVLRTLQRFIPRRRP